MIITKGAKVKEKERYDRRGVVLGGGECIELCIYFPPQLSILAANLVSSVGWGLPNFDEFVALRRTASRGIFPAPHGAPGWWTSFQLIGRTWSGDRIGDMGEVNRHVDKTCLHLDQSNQLVFGVGFSFSSFKFLFICFSGLKVICLLGLNDNRLGEDGETLQRVTLSQVHERNGLDGMKKMWTGAMIATRSMWLKKMWTGAMTATRSI